MSIRKRVLGGGVAVGLALTGWGMVGGAGAAEATSCTLIGANRVCTDFSSGSGYRSIGVGTSRPDGGPPYYLVGLFCNGSSATVFYAVGTPDVGHQDISALAPTLCP